MTKTTLLSLSSIEYFLILPASSSGNGCGGRAGRWGAGVVCSVISILSPVESITPMTDVPERQMDDDLEGLRPEVAEIVKRINRASDAIIDRAVKRFVETVDRITIPSMRAAVLFDLHKDLERPPERPTKKPRRRRRKPALRALLRAILGG
jgi:hypothetical protein